MDFLFLGSKITVDGDCSHEIKTLAPWERNYDKSRQCIKKQRRHFANKGLYSQNYDFSSSHVWMWELNHKEAWASKNRCLQIVVLEKTLESPLDYKEINPKGNQPWIFIVRTDAEAEAPILWSPDVKNWFTGKHPDPGKYWRQEEKGVTEDEVIRWHHRLHGHDFEQTLGDTEGQGSLACCSPWGSKLDMPEGLNNNNNILKEKRLGLRRKYAKVWPYFSWL